MNEILVLLLCAIGINLWMFLPAYLLRTDAFTDISYAASFTVMASYCFSVRPITLNTSLLFLMILLWASRLGGYLFIRIIKTKKDRRFDGIRDSFWRLLFFWFWQGVSVWIVMLPSLFLFQLADETFPIVSQVGAAIFFIGWLLETVADYQKYTFKKKPYNKKKWMHNGLWKYSRHPNYLGEILVWIGIYIFAYPHLTHTHAIVALLSPLYISFILGFVSGIPILEGSADARWGEDPAYQAYKKKTSLLVPFVL